MILVPAIDIKDEKCVRLFKGDYSKETIYSDNPLEMAETWMSQGTNNLHIVDLDGAKAGKPINFTIIESIRKEFPNLFIQVGGGIRNQENIDRYIDVGIDKVIIGTKVVADPEFIKKIENAFHCKKQSTPFRPKMIKEFGMYHQHQWYSINFKRHELLDNNILSNLDINILNKYC